MKNTKRRFAFYLFCVIGFFVVIGIGCKKEKAILPEVNTTEVTIVTPVSASCTGIVISAGNSNLIEKGLCWRNSSLPTIEDNKVSAYLYPYLVNFDLRISGLTANATYYVRAYATSEAGTSYGNELSFTTPSDLTGEKGTVTDVDGNVYQTIGIGSQIWVAENLKTTKFNDGTSIPLVTDNTAWSLLFSPAYCWYNNDELSNKNTYGALYNWYTVGTGKLCPSGWHIPGDTEWTVIEIFLGGPEVAGGKMKIPGTKYWKSPNAGATNSSGFTSLPGGLRGSDGSFDYIRESNLFWTSSGNYSTYAWYRAQDYLAIEITRGSNTVLWGGYIRCIRD
jgi:uncharacterized protein (TIGR02145 family)